MNENTIEVKLKAKDDVSPVVDNLADNTQSQFERMKTYVQDHWKSIALAAAAVSASITAAFYKVTQAAMDQEDAISKLEGAMRRMGDYTPSASKELQDYATALQSVTRYSDDAIISAQANLQNYGMTITEVKRATQATLDLAAAKRMDLMAASELVGKAFAGETQTLSRYGIILDDNIPKTEKFAAVMELLTQRFGGEAQREAETYRGMIARLGNAWGELEEAMGRVVTESDATNAAIDRTKSILEGLTKFIDEHQTVAKIVAISAAFTAAATAAGTLALAVSKLLPLLTALGAGGALTALIGAAPWLLTAGAGLGGGYMLGNYIRSGHTNLLSNANAWEENAAIAEADRLRKEAEDEQKSLLDRLNKKRAAQAQTGGTGGTVGLSDQGIISQAISDIRNNEDMAALDRMEREKEAQGLGYSSVKDFQNYHIAQQQFKEASKNSLRNQEEQLEQGGYEEWAKEQEERQRIQLENFEVTKTKANEFYSWMETRSREAADAAQANFTGYFYNMFTGKIRNLKDAWKGFCESIYNAWAQTLAKMAAQALTNALFGSLISSFGGMFGGGGASMSADQMTYQTMQGAANFPAPAGFAEGGVLTRPTFALAGEAGPEAFVPLSRGRAIPVEMRGGGQNAPNVTIVVNYPHDGDSVKRMLATEGDTLAGLVYQNFRDRGLMYHMVQQRS